MEELKIEQEYFEQIRAKLLVDHAGKFALIKGTDLIDTFDTAENAYVAGVQKFGNVPFLIKLIQEHESVQHIPAMTLGLLRAAV